MFLLVLVTAPWPYGGSADWARYALTGVVLLAAGAWAASRAFAARGVPRFAGRVLLLPAIALVQLALVPHLSREWWLEASLVLLGCLATLLFWSDRARERGSAWRLASAILVVCAAELVFGVVQHAEDPARIYGRLLPIVTSPFGSYVNHNHFACLLEMGALVGWGLTLGSLRRSGLTPASMALGGLSAALVTAQLASQSRGGLVAVAVGLTFLALNLRRTGGEAGGRPLIGKGLVALGLGCVLAFAVLALPDEALHRLASALDPGDTSRLYRLDVTRDTMRMVMARPVLGAGLGNFADVFPAFKRGHGDVRTAHAENDALEFGAEMGAAGLIGLAWLAGGILSGFEERQRHGRDPVRLGLASGAMAACVALLAHSFLDFNLRVPANALLFASLAGLASCPHTEPPTLRPWTSGSLAALLFLGASLSLYRSLGAWSLGEALSVSDPNLQIAALDATLRSHPGLADGFRERGSAWCRQAGPANSAIERGRLERGLSDFERAIALRPAWASAWTDLGWTQFRLGQSGAAGVSLDRAVALDPTDPYTGVARADFLGRVAGARAGVDELLRLEDAFPGWDHQAAVAVARGWTTDEELLRRLNP